MNTNDSRNRESSSVRPTGFFGLGGMGCLTCLWLAALSFRDKTGRDNTLPLTRLCLDLDHGSANVSRRLSAVDPLRHLDAAELHLLPDHAIRDLRQALERDPATRIYARRMNGVGGTTTLQGAGGAPIVGLAAAVADWDAIDHRVAQALEQQRDALRISDAVQRGARVALDAPATLYITLNGDAGAGSGQFPLVAMLSRHHAQRLGWANFKIVLLVAASLPSNGGEPVTGAINFTTLLRQIAMSHRHADRVVVHGFGGRVLRGIGPLADRVIVFGPSAGGKLISASRDALALRMAMYVHQATQAAASDEADSYFRDADHVVAEHDALIGPRIFGRAGFSVLFHDAERARQMLTHCGRERLGRYLLSENHD